MISKDSDIRVSVKCVYVLLKKKFPYSFDGWRSYILYFQFDKNIQETELDWQHLEDRDYTFFTCFLLGCSTVIV